MKCCTRRTSTAVEDAVRLRKVFMPKTDASRLQAELDQLRVENKKLKSELARAGSVVTETAQLAEIATQLHTQFTWTGTRALSTSQIARYSRQLLLPSFGLQGWCEVLVLARLCS